MVCSVHWHNLCVQQLYMFVLFINTLRPRQNDCHFPDGISKCIFLSKNVSRLHWNLYLTVQLTNIPALVQIMTRRLQGDKSLSKPMMVRFQTHICVTWPQWVNSLKPLQNGLNLETLPNAFIEWKYRNLPALVQIMGWHWQGDKSLSEPMMVRLQTLTKWTPFSRHLQIFFWMEI